jgi:DNA (cytosine-5)-methyltransferase 1
MKVLDLFSGIGGFSLGLERAGMKTIAFCEIDPFCRKVLKKHWPDVPIFEDVRTLTNEQVGPVDVICGGFPCQDISVAGKGAGIEGERSGLWKEYARLIGEIRPRYVIVENVAALLGRGIGRVLGDLAALGYDAEWHCIPATYIGAKHIRDRVWIIANPSSFGLEGPILTRDSVSQTGVAFDWCAPQRAHEQMDWNEWATESPVLGADDDVPECVDAVDALGNAVVPQIPELIGKAIMEEIKAKLSSK